MRQPASLSSWDHLVNIRKNWSFWGLCREESTWAELGHQERVRVDDVEGGVQQKPEKRECFDHISCIGNHGVDGCLALEEKRKHWEESLFFWASIVVFLSQGGLLFFARGFHDHCTIFKLLELGFQTNFSIILFCSVFSSIRRKLLDKYKLKIQNLFMIHTMGKEKSLPSRESLQMIDVLFYIIYR